MSPRLLSISIDLDTLRFYSQIHGLSDFSPPRPDPIYTHALPRLLDLFSSLSIRATFFVIGEDLHEPAHQAALKRAIAEGHELANHTFYHSYRLTHLPPASLEAEIAGGQQAIESLLPQGRRVTGFRCPGYNLLPPVIACLRKLGYRYDSSIFPCPPYYLAKGAVLLWQALQGRQSRSILGSPRVLLSPLHPYHPSDDDPHRPKKARNPAFDAQASSVSTRAASPASSVPSSPSLGPNDPNGPNDLWEIPMAVLPYSRLPFIGTFLLMAPSALLPRLTSQAAAFYPLLQVELHGIDLLDVSDHPAAFSLKPFQPDLSVPLAEKLRRFRLIFSQLLQTHRPLPIEETLPLLPLA